MSKELARSVLRVIIWLCELIRCVTVKKSRLVFKQVRICGVVVKGDIKEMKIEFGQTIDITATPVGGSGIQPGSAVWSVQAADVDGNDRSSDYTVTPNAANELNCKFKHSGTTESIGVATIRADGDKDADEEAVVVGTLALVADEPNVSAFDMSGTIAVEPPPEPTPVP